MIILVICTEGESSEPNYIKALKAVLFGTSARSTMNVEVVPVPLGGNHGHKKIFEKADKELERRKEDNYSILSAVDTEDTIEKWMIVDYDKMEKHNISEPDFRRKASEFGYNLVINKPNFEFFVLCNFMSYEEASKIATKDFCNTLNDEISDYNIKHGFDKPERSALRLPKYAKNKNIAEELFWKLLDQNPELIDTMSQNNSIGTNISSRYSEMWKIIKRIGDI